MAIMYLMDPEGMLKLLEMVSFIRSNHGPLFAFCVEATEERADSVHPMTPGAVLERWGRPGDEEASFLSLRLRSYNTAAKRNAHEHKI